MGQGTSHNEHNKIEREKKGNDKPRYQKPPKGRRADFL